MLNLYERELYDYNVHLDCMKEQQKEAKQVLSKVVRQDYIEDFAMILAAAWNSRCHEAEEFAKDHDLKDSDFFAILEDFKEYKLAKNREGDGYYE